MAHVTKKPKKKHQPSKEPPKPVKKEKKKMDDKAKPKADEEEHSKAPKQEAKPKPAPEKYLKDGTLNPEVVGGSMKLLCAECGQEIGENDSRQSRVPDNARIHYPKCPPAPEVPKG